jgi:hypothetical protein
MKKTRGQKSRVRVPLTFTTFKVTMPIIGYINSYKTPNQFSVNKRWLTDIKLWLCSGGPFLSLTLFCNRDFVTGIQLINI